MKVRLTLALLTAALFVPSGAAAAQNKLPLPAAKHKTKQLANGICAGIGSCYRTRVPTCTRRSLPRVDCLALFDFTEGVTCSMVIVNRLEPQGLVHQGHRAIHCG